jgi:tetratricopeptide (TPR) repeat protein
MTDSPDLSKPLPESLENPQTPEEYIHRGWSLHIRNEFKDSEASFRKALELDPDSVEAAYGIGMSLRVQGKEEEANQYFQKTLDILNSDSVKMDPARATMFRHLAETHIKMSVLPGNMEAEL